MADNVASRVLPMAGPYLQQKYLRLEGEPEEKEEAKDGPVPARWHAGHDFGRVQVHDLTSARIQTQPLEEPADELEEEADSLADEVVRSSGSTAGAPLDPPQSRRLDEENETIQTKREDTGSHQRLADPSLRPPSMGGRKLPGPTQWLMESGFGRRFDRVRVHTGSEADRLSRQLSARAFTFGRDVYFRQGEFQPNTTEGKRLIAHELTHVAQQGHAPLSGPSTAGSPDRASPSRELSPRIQRKVSLTEDLRTNDLNEAEQWMSFLKEDPDVRRTSVGYTIFKLNDSMIPDEVGATVVPTSDGLLRSWVTKIPENRVSYEVHLPQKRDSWCVTLPMSVVQSVFHEDCSKFDPDDPNVIEALVQKNCKSIEGGGAGTVLVEAGQADVPEDVERHENIHVKHLRDLYDILVLPWDIALQNHFGEKNAIVGKDEEDLGEKYRRAGVITAFELFTAVLRIWGEWGDKLDSTDPEMLFWRSPDSTCSLVKAKVQSTLPAGEMVIEVHVGETEGGD